MNLLTVENLISLVSLSAMEIVLGIDNIVFIAILSQKLPKVQQKKVQRLGLTLALGLRLGLLFTISWIMRLTQPLLPPILGHALSGRDLVLLVGGLFLIAKSTHEIYDKLEVQHEEGQAGGGQSRFGMVLAQILALDIVFSLDSVITAVGMVPTIPIMVIAMVLSVVVMLIFAPGVSAFINRHPSMKILALSFLLLIGVLLVAESFDKHISKGYIYSAMAFSLVVEMFNMRFRKRQKAVTLHHRFEASSSSSPSDPGGPTSASAP